MKTEPECFGLGTCTCVYHSLFILNILQGASPEEGQIRIMIQDYIYYSIVPSTVMHVHVVTECIQHNYAEHACMGVYIATSKLRLMLLVVLI